MADIFNKNFRLLFLIFVLTELISFSGYLWPFLNVAGFLVIFISALILSWRRPEYGLWLVLAELFIGSKGYLFHLALGGHALSIRIALWLAVMSVWTVRFFIAWLETKRIPLPRFWQSRYRNYFLVLFAFIAWGAVNGLASRNGSENVFFDFNNWLYLALILPIYDIYLKKDDRILIQFRQIFIASAFWLAVKSFILLFIFSHNLLGLVYEIYRWVRESGVGEITNIQGGFYRVFFQSHIYIMAAFFVLLFDLVQGKLSGANKRQYGFAAAMSVILFASNLIAFSRSNWIGLLAGLALMSFVFLLNKEWGKVGRLTGCLAAIAIASFLLIITTVKFPYPKPIGGFNTVSLLSERASQITGEAGVSSRWALLPPLWQSVSQQPLLGQGYGATVTYYSQDPRILANNPSGKYTTYAFEWGWLDIWLKLGIFGLLSYLFLAAIIVYNCLKAYTCKADDNIVMLIGLACGYVGVLAISFFSPYMNHPLGLGYLMLLAAILETAPVAIHTCASSVFKLYSELCKNNFNGR